MRPINFMLADAASYGREGKLYIHGGGVTDVVATEFPHTLPRLSVVVTLDPEDEPPGSEHVVRVAFRTPDDEELPFGEPGKFRLPEVAPDAIGGAAVLNMIATFTGVEFPSAGLYRVRLYVNDHPLTELPLAVGSQSESGEWRDVGL